MNLFAYRAAEKEIELCKTVSELETLIRRYAAQLSKLPINSYWNTVPKDSNVENQIFIYKLLTLSLKHFVFKSKRQLPDFIYIQHLNSQQALLTWILGWDKPHYKGPFDKVTEYTQFMDWFEFDTVLELPPNHTDYVEALNGIIGANPIHFKVIFNNNLTVFDTHSTQLPQTTQRLIYAIRYKQVNFPNKPQTIWDLFLEEMRKQADDATDVQLNKECIKLEQQINALKSFKEYYVKQ